MRKIVHNRLIFRFVTIVILVLSLVTNIILTPTVKAAGDYDATHDVSGTIRYEDRLFNMDGFQGTDWKPVRWATVELLDQNGSILDSAYTNDAGYYTFDTQDVPVGEQVRVRTKTVS